MILGPSDGLPKEVDFLVVGAGTIGLPLARELARTTARKVLCIESGGWSQEADTDPLNEVEQTGAAYAGADHGRFRCLGGTSTRWGGALIPLRPRDMAGWPVQWCDLAPYVPQVEELFGLEPGPYDDAGAEILVDDRFQPRLAKWPPFSKRNVWRLLGRELRSHRQVQIAIESVVTGLAPREHGVHATVVRRGAHETILARRVIVAAGAIETTRLLLLLDRAMGGRVSQRSPALGRYFSDHLSCPVGRLVPIDRNALNRLFGFRFTRSGTMRNLRFESDAGPSGFMHVGYETDGASGFDHLRATMQRLQRGRLPELGTVAGLFGSMPWLARAAGWRFLEQRQLFPDLADLVVHAVVEQLPMEQSHIALSADRVDALGTPVPVIDWSVSIADVDNLLALARQFADAWSAGEGFQIARFEPFAAGPIADTIQASGGIYHPTGSTRMGASAGDGVVDADLRLFAEPRIQLCATSVLPSGGSANSTMTALLLAMRLAAQHGAAVKEGRA